MTILASRTRAGGTAPSRAATAVIWSAGTNRIPAAGSMNSRIGQGQATRSTFTLSRLTHFTFDLLGRRQELAAYSRSLVDLNLRAVLALLAQNHRIQAARLPHRRPPRRGRGQSGPKVWRRLPACSRAVQPVGGGSGPKGRGVSAWRPRWRAGPASTVYCRIGGRDARAFFGGQGGESSLDRRDRRRLPGLVSPAWTSLAPPRPHFPPGSVWSWTNTQHPAAVALRQQREVRWSVHVASGWPSGEDSLTL